MTDIQREQLENYFKPIYYIEYETKVDGELFPRVFRMGYYNCNEKEALQAYKQFGGVRIIEKNVRTGLEKIIKTRDIA